MTVFTRALAINNYGNPKFIVATDPANGTHSTLASALAAAVSGDTILLRDSVTENVNLVAGVNIVAFVGSETTPTVSITGKLSFASAGTVTISGIRLTTNSDNFLAVTGSAASIVNLENCYLNCLNATGISFTTANASSVINILNCAGNLGTTGIGLYSMSATGLIRLRYTAMTNTGLSTTATSNSAGSVICIFCNFGFPISTSSGGNINYNNSNINTAGINTTCLTTAGTGTSVSTLSSFSSGSASAISVGSGTTLAVDNAVVSSSNTNPITGAGTIIYSSISMTGTASEINTTTQTGNYVQLVKFRARSQPAFSMYTASAVTNATGDGTIADVTGYTSIVDQNSNFNTTTGVFTAPVTGLYQFNYTVRIGNIAAGHTSSVVYIRTTAGDYFLFDINPTATKDVITTGLSVAGTLMIPMTATNTAKLAVGVSGSTKTVTIATNCFFSGYLAC